MQNIYKICLISLITFSYLISLPTHSFPKDSKLPQEIKNFYEDLNFANLHSKKKEKRYISYLLSPQPRILLPLLLELKESYDNNPGKKLQNKKRLNEVYYRLLKVNNKIWDADPGIYGTVWRIGPDYISYYGYYEVEKVEYNHDIIKIHADSYNILTVHNEYFVANYGTEKNASEKYYSKEFFKLIEKKKAYNKHRTEIHFWVKFDDVWMIGDKSIMLLGLNKLSLL